MQAVLCGKTTKAAAVPDVHITVHTAPPPAGQKIYSKSQPTVIRMVITGLKVLLTASASGRWLFFCHLFRQCHMPVKRRQYLHLSVCKLYNEYKKELPREFLFCSKLFSVAFPGFDFVLFQNPVSSCPFLVRFNGIGQHLAHNAFIFLQQYFQQGGLFHPEGVYDFPVLL